MREISDIIKDWWKKWKSPKVKPQKPKDAQQIATAGSRNDLVKNMVVGVKYDVLFRRWDHNIVDAKLEKRADGTLIVTESYLSKKYRVYVDGSVEDGNITGMKQTWFI